MSVDGLIWVFSWQRSHYSLASFFKIAKTFKFRIMCTLVKVLAPIITNVSFLNWYYCQCEKTITDARKHSPCGV